MTTATVPRSMDTLLLKDEVENFLYTEADLLDERRFNEWLELLADDLRYIMPIRRNAPPDRPEAEFTRGGQDMCWFDEGKITLSKRVQQILTREHWAEEPSSRLSHVVSNVRVVAVVGDEVETTCRFIVYRDRQDAETDLFVGRRRDRVRRIDGDWKLVYREILLDQSTLQAKNLTFFF